MKAFGEAVGLLLAVVVIAWGTLVWYTEPQRKPVVACRPVYWFSSGVQTTSAAAVASTAPDSTRTSSQAPQVNDGATGRVMPVADRVALACLRFTDRLFN